MKKALALIVSVIVFISCMSMTSFADNKVKLYISDVEVNAGDNFTADIMISDNSDLSGAVIDVCYDSSKIKFVNGNVGGIVDDNAQVAIRDLKSSVRFTYLDASESVSSAGILFSLDFTALDDAAGETKLEIKIDNPGDFIGSDSQKLSYTLTPGTVSIKNNSLPVANETLSETETESSTDAESTQKAANEKASEITTASESQEKGKDKEGKEDFNDNKKIIITIVATCVIFLLAGLLINEVYKGKRDNKKKKSKKNKKRGKK